MLRAGHPKNAPKHVRAALAYLRHCGASDILVRQKRRVRISWRYGHHRMAISLATTPGDGGDDTSIAQQLIRRRYREAGIEVGA